MISFKPVLTAIVLSAMVPLAACNDTADNETTTVETSDNMTLASALTGDKSLTTLASAVTETGLGSLFDGPGDYTILAPDNAAFAKLGEDAKTLMQPDQKAVLVAILRDHLIPGDLSVEAIRNAITAQGGPVTMRTLGAGDVTFSMDGKDIVITSDDGVTGKISGPGIAAANGSVIQVDTVLRKADAAG